MKAVVQQITMPLDKRVICISDIHGNLELLKKLLHQVQYVENDMLVFLGDLYTKGKQCHATLKFIIDLSEKEDVHIIQGNCDWQEEYLTEFEKSWLKSLPHIIEAEKYIFVHGGVSSGDLHVQEAVECVKNDCFMEKGLKFNKYIITGHWPTVNYCHKIPCFNPIVNEENRIIAIDGGNAVTGKAGQLNVFIIENGCFSFQYADSLPVIKSPKAQAESGGSLNITWLDRFVEMVEKGNVLSKYRHIRSGKILTLPNHYIWNDNDGNLCALSYGTDYCLSVEKGEEISVIDDFGSSIFAKKNGTAGWIHL